MLVSWFATHCVRAWIKQLPVFLAYDITPELGWPTTHQLRSCIGPPVPGIVTYTREHVQGNNASWHGICCNCDGGLRTYYSEDTIKDVASSRAKASASGHFCGDYNQREFDYNAGHMHRHQQQPKSPSIDNLVLMQAGAGRYPAGSPTSRAEAAGWVACR